MSINVHVVNSSNQHQSKPLFTLNPEPNFIIIFILGLPETLRLFQGFLQGKKFEREAKLDYIASNDTMIDELWRERIRKKAPPETESRALPLEHLT
jgi:hypothetical protein